MAPRMPTSLTLSASARRRSAASASSGIERRNERQAGHERRILLGRRADELGHPVGHLDRAVVGDLVDGPLGPLALPHRAGRLDEALLLERLHHGVERPVVEAHALLLGPAAQRLRHLVGVHGLLVQADQHRQGQGVRTGPSRHAGHNTLFRVICKECSEERPPLPTRTPGPRGNSPAISGVTCALVAPTVLHVAPHPDDEAVGCPGALLHLRDRGWTVVSVIASLGLRGAAGPPARRGRGGVGPGRLRPRLPRPAPEPRPRRRPGPGHPTASPPSCPAIVEEHERLHRRRRPRRTTCTTATRRSAGASNMPWPPCHRPCAGGCGACGATSPRPTSSTPSTSKVLDRALHILDAYTGELERNDYRPFLTGRAAANAVMGSERVFGFGSPAATTLPYAELLTEVRLLDGRFMASEPHHLDQGPEPTTMYDVDLTPWLESPSVHELVGLHPRGARRPRGPRRARDDDARRARPRSSSTTSAATASSWCPTC